MPLVFKREEITSIKSKCFVNVVNNSFLGNKEIYRNSEIKSILGNNFNYSDILTLNNVIWNCKNVINVKAPTYDVNNPKQSEKDLGKTYIDSLDIFIGKNTKSGKPVSNSFYDRLSITLPVILYENYPDINDADGKMMQKMIFIAINTINKYVFNDNRSISVRLVFNDYIDTKINKTIDLNYYNFLNKNKLFTNKGTKIGSHDYVQTIYDYLVKSGVKNTKFYYKANFNKDRFEQVMSGRSLTKENIFALAIALELSKEQFKNLINLAGYTLSNFYLLDEIVDKFISKKKFSIIYINICLFNNGLKQLGE